MTAAQSLRSPVAKPRSSGTGLASAWLAQAPRCRPRRWQSMPAKSRTRAQVAVSSGQRAVILARAARSASVRLPGGVRIQLATFFGAGAGGRRGGSWPGAAGRCGGAACAGCRGSRGRGSPRAAGRCCGSLRSHRCVQVGQVRIQEAGRAGRGAAGQLAGVSGGGVAAHGLAVQVQGAADLGQGQPAAERGVDLGVPGAGPQLRSCPSAAGAAGGPACRARRVRPAGRTGGGQRPVRRPRPGCATERW